MSPMWSSEKSDNHKTNKSFSSSSTSSFSSSSSSSSTCSPFSSNPNTRRTMEEVWKDMNVPSIPGEDPHITNLNFHGVNLQDFLAQPFAKIPQKTPLFTPPPTHALNLNSCPDFNNFEEPSRVAPISKATPYKGFGSSSPTNKRGSDPDESTGDRRYKRMIKNRESAARSRARKQAYRFELEGEVTVLRNENERLKNQQKMLKKFELVEASQAPPKKTLCRTSTAPF